MKEGGSVTLEAHPSHGSYVVLCGAWILLTGLYIAVAVVRSDPEALKVAALTLAVALAWAAWLRGHWIRVEGSLLEYRDGFYRKRQCLLDEVVSVDDCWVEYSRTGSLLRIPRIALILAGSPDAPIVINPKPFRLADLRQLHALLGGSANRSRNKSKSK